MTNKYAIIENGVIVNMAAADAEFAAQQNWVLTPDYVDGEVVTKGWIYDGSNFTAPPVTEVVTPPPTNAELQEQLAILQAQIALLINP
jgi:hypothetical protein